MLSRAVLPLMANARQRPHRQRRVDRGLKGFKLHLGLLRVEVTRFLGPHAGARARVGSKADGERGVPGGRTPDMSPRLGADHLEDDGPNEAESRDALAKMIPSGRPTKPEEVAELVGFLATADAALAVTGSAYSMDGGESA